MDKIDQIQENIIDFYCKSSEIILNNRLITYNSVQHLFSKTFLKTNPNLKYQLRTDHKYNIEQNIPSQWSMNPSKLLVIEFFMNSKKSDEKYMVEQWIFDMNISQDSKLKFPNESSLSAYKRLTILLRSISLLTKQLPLYRSYIFDSNNPIDLKFKEYYDIDYNIHFSSKSLSNWNETAYNNLASYTNNDIIVPPNIIFSFKVNYAKNLKFLQTQIEEFEKMISTRKMTGSFDNNTKDSHSENNVSFGQEIGQTNSPKFAHWGSQQFSEASPPESLSHISSPICTQKDLNDGNLKK